MRNFLTGWFLVVTALSLTLGILFLAYMYLGEAAIVAIAVIAFMSVLFGEVLVAIGQNFHDWRNSR